MDFNRIADKETVFKKDFRIKEFREITEDKGGALETIVCLDSDNREVVIITRKDGEILSQEATTDAQESGLYEDVAKKYGVKKEDLKYTKVSLAAARSSNKSGKEDRKSREAEPSDHKSEKMDLLKKAEDIGMAKQHLVEISHHLKELNNIEFGSKETPEWVISKMASAADDIAEVAHFMDSGEKLGKSKCPKCGSDSCQCNKDLTKSLDFMKKCSSLKKSKCKCASNECQCNKDLNKSLEFMKKCSSKASPSKMLEKGTFIGNPSTVPQLAMSDSSPSNLNKGDLIQGNFPKKPDESNEEPKTRDEKIKFSLGKVKSSMAAINQLTDKNNKGE